MSDRSLTAETLRALSQYDPAPGVFTWRRRPEHAAYAQAAREHFGDFARTG